MKLQWVRELSSTVSVELAEIMASMTRLQWVRELSSTVRVTQRLCSEDYTQELQWVRELSSTVRAHRLLARW